MRAHVAHIIHQLLWFVATASTPTLDMTPSDGNLLVTFTVFDEDLFL
jgi:hypothetical protein